MKEIWKNVKGYGSRYQISNLGNIRSTLKTEFIFKENDYTFIKNCKKIPYTKIKYLKPGKTKQNYLMVRLSKNCICQSFYIHRLVAMHFILNPNKLPNVCHKDNNPENNKVDNLYWGTQKDNIHQAISEGRFDKQLKKVGISVK